eukprot:scaffold300644_cov33-Prasinocladus_malaysianus.AAC.1
MYVAVKVALNGTQAADGVQSQTGQSLSAANQSQTEAGSGYALAKFCVLYAWTSAPCPAYRASAIRANVSNILQSIKPLEMAGGCAHAWLRAVACN